MEAIDLIAAAHIGKGLNFDSSSSEYVKVDDASSLDISSSMTFSTWFNTDALPGSSSAISVLDKTGDFDLDTAGTQLNYGIVILNGLTLPGHGISLGFEDSSHADYFAEYSVTLTTGQWYHIVGVFDDTNNVQRLYIDGIEEDTVTDVTVTPATNNYDLYFAMDNADYPWSLSDYFDGELDEIRISNVARSDGWITTHSITKTRRGHLLLWIRRRLFWRVL